jgi:putative ABC transport system ATP-binding protein
LTDYSVICNDTMVTFGEVLALPRTSLHVEPGQSVAIMGPSGSGKSTLLACVQGLQRPSSGTMTVLGQDQTSASRRALSGLRRTRMGLIQQGADLLEEFSTVENVAFPLLFDGMKRPQALELADATLASVGMSHRRDADVRSLSGGEAQRVAVARALVQPDVSLVVADEPTASLDIDNAHTVTELLLAAATHRQAAVLLATHDPAVAKLCDRIHHLAREHDAA